MTIDERTEELLRQLDGSGSEAERRAINQLRATRTPLPRLLLLKFRNSPKWRVRTACVYYCLAYAKTCDDAVTLGREAIADRSKVVRYRGCMLLALSQRRDVLSDLNQRLVGSTGSDTENIRAAIDAIEHQNHNYFVDPDHTGRISLTLDEPPFDSAQDTAET